MINIVLYEPEIPFNTGNIGRTCVATGSRLHLIKPLGFSLDAKEIKRAGLDYWPRLDYKVYENFQDFLEQNSNPKIWMATTKAHKVYSDVNYGPDDYIMFGPESRGIPEEILVSRKEECVRLPMLAEERSINLCNSVSIFLYEALRQNDFPGLKKYGELHRLKWE
jgi:tRNA (cytidine/uridine-2'-O-)-methyltransferase